MQLVILNNLSKVFSFMSVSKTYIHTHISILFYFCIDQYILLFCLRKQVWYIEQTCRKINPKIDIRFQEKNCTHGIYSSKEKVKTNNFKLFQKTFIFQLFVFQIFAIYEYIFKQRYESVLC